MTTLRHQPLNLDDLKPAGRSNFAPRAKQVYLNAEGTSYFRILPSYDEGTSKFFSQFYAHWLTNEDGSKMKAACTKFSDGYCPLCESSAEQKTLAERARVNGDIVKSQLLEKASGSLRASKSVYMNGVSETGEIVILNMNATVFGLLSKKLEQAVGQGFDPLDPKTGVWFRFSKRGVGKEAYEVDFKKTTVMVEGERLEKNDRTPLADELIATLPTAASDLNNTDTLYIQTFSPKDLSDFLRGIPLNNKFKKKTAQQSTSSEVSTPSVQAATSEDNKGSEGSTYTPTTPQQAAPKSTAAPTTTRASSASEEIARLRNLSRTKQ